MIGVPQVVMRKTLLFLYIIISYTVIAQKQNNIWYFGNKAGIDFNTSPPTALTNGGMVTFEAAATISDTAGNLLFYTNGGGNKNKQYTGGVWNRNHSLMPNGALDNSYSCNSSSQGALIIPDPGNPDEYYIFTTDCYENGLSGGLRFLKVDMSLDGGYGDVTQKNVLVLNNTIEALTGIKHANGKDYWVISPEKNSNRIHAFRVTCEGIFPPVTSYGSHVGVSWGGQFNHSTSGEKLALSTRNDLSVFDFDRHTGELSNHKSLGELKSSGCVFSPNEQILYTENYNSHPSEICQFDLTASDVIASKTVLYTSFSDLGKMLLGRDGKIYVGKSTGSTLSVIHNPNILGTGCNFSYHGFSLNGRNAALSMPNFAIHTPGNPFNVELAEIKASPQQVCLNEPFTASLVGVDEFSATIENWSIDGNTSNDGGISEEYYFSSTGTKTINVTISNGCETRTLSKDIFIGVKTDIEISQNPDPVCSGKSIKLTVEHAPEVSFFWNDDGSSDNPRTINSVVGGSIYTLTPQGNDVCNKEKRIIINTFPIPPPLPQNNYHFCQNEEVTEPLSPNGSDIIWYDSDMNLLSSAPIINTENVGSFHFFVSKADRTCNSEPSKIEAIIHSTPKTPSNQTITYCKNENPDKLYPYGTMYRWYDSNMNQLSTPITPSTSNPSTTTFYIQEFNDYCESEFGKVTVIVNNLPEVNIAQNPNPTCTGGDANLQVNHTTGSMFTWNDASGNKNPRVIKAPENGDHYSVSVTDNNNCENTAEIQLNVDCECSVNLGENLIEGGDFETQQEFYSDLPRCISCCKYGHYDDQAMLGTNSCSFFEPIVDHTLQDGTGKYLLIDPTYTGSVSWGKKIRIKKKGMYFFSFWINAGIFPGGVDFNVYANETLLGKISVTDENAWSKHCLQWREDFEGCSKEIALEFRHIYKGYDDFLIDDMFLGVLPDESEVISTITEVTDTLCKGDSVQLFATGGAAYKWLGNPEEINCISCFSTWVKPTKTTAYSVEILKTDGCKDTLTTTVHVYKPLPVSITQNPLPVCLGDDVTLLVAIDGEGTFLWDDATNSQNPRTVKSPENTDFYSLTTTDHRNCKNKTGIHIQVIPLPSANIQQTPENVCEGNDAHLKVILPEGTSFVWNDNVSSENPRIISTPKNNDQYTITLSDENSCQNTASFNISVLPLPPDQHDQLITYCQYENPKPLTPTGENYLWYDADMKPILGTPLVNTSHVGITKYYVSEVNEGCIGSPGEVSIEITPFEESIQVDTMFHFFVSKEKSCENDSIAVVFENILTTNDSIGGRFIVKENETLVSDYEIGARAGMSSVVKVPTHQADSVTIMFIPGSFYTNGELPCHNQISPSSKWTHTIQIIPTVSISLNGGGSFCGTDYVTYTLVVNAEDPYKKLDFPTVINISENGKLFPYAISSLGDHHFTHTLNDSLIVQLQPSSFTCQSIDVKPIKFFSLETDLEMTYNVLSNSELCSGEIFNLQLHFSGNPPYILEYEVNGQLDSIITSQTEYQLNIDPSKYNGEGEYTLRFLQLTNPSCTKIFPRYLETFENTEMVVFEINSPPSGTNYACMGDTLRINFQAVVSNLKTTDALTLTFKHLQSGLEIVRNNYLGGALEFILNTEEGTQTLELTNVVNTLGCPIPFSPWTRSVTYNSIKMESKVERIPCGPTMGVVSYVFNKGKEHINSILINEIDKTQEILAAERIEDLYLPQHKVLVTYNNACSLMYENDVPAITPFPVDIEQKGFSCWNQTSGFLHVRLKENNPFEVKINDNIHYGLDVVQPIDTGFHQIAITNLKNNCILFFNEPVYPPPPFELVNYPVNPTCFTILDGSTVFDIQNENTPFEVRVYMETNEYDSTLFFDSTFFQIDHLESGNKYNYTVTDNIGCQRKGSFFIRASKQLDWSAKKLKDSDCISGGEIQVDIERSATVYLNEIPHNNLLISDLKPGEYVLKVQEGDCYQGKDTVVIQDNKRAVNVTPLSPDCYNKSTGHISTNISGTNGPVYFYLDGDFYFSIDELEIPIGEHTVVVKDDYCKLYDTLTVTIKKRDTLKPFIKEITPPLCAESYDGTIELGSNGGTAPFWFDFDQSGFHARNVWENLSAGNYTVKIMDGNYCISPEIEISIPAPDELSLNYDLQFNEQSGLHKLILQSSGGNPPYSYGLDGEKLTSNPVFTNLTEGKFSFVTQDENGCVAYQEIEIGTRITDINETESENLIGVYPNPFSGNVDIVCKMCDSEPINVAIFDDAGKLIFQKEGKWNGIETNIEEFLNQSAAGYYHLNFRSKQKPVHISVVKM